MPDSGRLACCLKYVVRTGKLAACCYMCTLEECCLFYQLAVSCHLSHPAAVLDEKHAQVWRLQCSTSDPVVSVSLFPAVGREKDGWLHDLSFESQHIVASCWCCDCIHT